ncbi:MAG TPA: hypothetical protein VMY59_08025 [Candidatus Thermoplasmatota archaeon]|nr:hypothetical protein [Candidatus Thermoplasmatota archaeon]
MIESVKAFIRYLFGRANDSDCPMWIEGFCSIPQGKPEVCKGYYNCVYLRVTRQ